MTLPQRIRRFLLARACNIMAERFPDFVIGNDYLRRWWIIPRNRWLNIYLHEFRASDDDRALHDHPWWSCSIILAGWYLEHLPADGNPASGRTVATPRFAGDITTRAASAAHRIEIVSRPAITLFITGPRRREWGFWCPKGWRSWRVFTARDDSGQIGRGCD